MNYHQLNITLKDVLALLVRAERLAVNLPNISMQGFLSYRRLKRCFDQGVVDVAEYGVLSRVVQRAERRLNNQFNYNGSFRPQPTENDGMSHLPTRLPFRIIDTDAPFSLADEFCSGGIALVGGLRSAKSVKSGHILTAFIEEGKSVFGFESKGAGEWDFTAIRGYPVFLLTVGAANDSAFRFNPLSNDGGEDEVCSQLEICAICAQRKDSLGLATYAARRFFANRRPSDRTQLTFAKLHRMLTTEIVPATHKHLFQQQLWPSLLNILESHMSGFGGCFNVEQGVDFETIIRNHGSLFINTSMLSLAQEEYLIASVGWKLYETTRRMFPNIQERQARTVLFVDESSPHLQPKLDQEQRHLGPISELLLKCRAG